VQQEQYLYEWSVEFANPTVLTTSLNIFAEAYDASSTSNI
jgi:hypothetical protein